MYGVNYLSIHILKISIRFRFFTRKHDIIVFWNFTGIKKKIIRSSLFFSLMFMYWAVIWIVCSFWQIYLVIWQMSCLTVLHCLYSLYTLSAFSWSVIQYQQSVRESVQLNPNTRTISSPAAALEQTSSPEHVQSETEKETSISCSGMTTLLTPTWLSRYEKGRVREKEWCEGWV